MELVKKFRNLEIFELSECPDVIKIPENIVYLSKLKQFTFCWNGGTDTSINWIYELDKISKLKNLEILKLGPYNQIGHLSGKIGKLKCLKILNLSLTQTQSLPKEVGNLINLEELDLSMTPIQSLPVELKKLKKLKRIDLTDTPISKDEKLKKEIISEYKHCEIKW